MLRQVVFLSALIIVAAGYPILTGWEIVPSTPIELSTPAAPTAEDADRIVASVEAPNPRDSVSLARDSRGHFIGEFRVNGRKVQAMVDTGATVIAINRTTARRAGVPLKGTDFTDMVGTANGKVRAAAVTLDVVEIGRIRVRNVSAVVLDDSALAGTLIGMSFLNRLSKFSVQDEQLVLDE